MILLHKANLVTGEKEAKGSILINGDTIEAVYFENEQGLIEVGNKSFPLSELPQNIAEAEIIDLEGKHIIAGGIDAHVHFREPGLTHKADMETESKAAVAGGVTTVFDMPNTNPATISAQAVADKIAMAKGRTLAKIAFHIGASNSNADDVCRMVKEGDSEAELAAKDIPGVKVFMGSSTGNMLVDSGSSLEKLFAIKEKPVLVH